MQEGPWTRYGAPQQAPAVPAQMPWERYQSQAAPSVAPAPAQPRPQRPAQPRPQSAPAPNLNELGITDEEELAALTAQYGSREAALEYQRQRVGGEPAMFTPDEEAANVQQRGMEAHALDRFQNRNSIDPTRAIREPWLLGEPIYMPRDEATGDVQTADGSYPLTTYPGLRTVEGGMQAFDPASHAYYAVTPEQAATIEARNRQSQKERQARVNREADPKYQAEYAAAQAGADNVPAWLANLTQGDTLGGLTYAVGASNFLDPMTEGIDRNLAAQAGRDAWRDQLADLVERDPFGSIGMQMVGGMLTPGLKGSGDWINGATGGARMGRAAAVGGGYGAVSGGLNSDGNVAEDTLTGAGLGAFAGAAGQGLVDRFARRGGGVDMTAARQLSREGVQLTPGQMLQEMPVVGGMLRGIEDRFTSLPIVGDAIQGARVRGFETANIAATNRALTPIGESLPSKMSPGYEAVEYAQDRLGQAYADVLSRVNVTVDEPLQTGIAQVLADAPASMGQARAEQLAEILSSRVMRNVDPATGGISGEEFKRIETTLGQQQRELARSLSNDERALGQALSDIRGEFRDALARQYPAEAPRLQQINTGYANLVRVEDAAGSAGAIARGGVFTPAQLAAAVRKNTGSRSQRGAGTGLMRDMATNMGEVLPSTIPDSGTAGRAGQIAAVASTGALFQPAIGLPVLAGVAPYTKIGQDIINRIYRASDPQQAIPILAEMADFVQQHPELRGAYQEAVQHVARLALPEAQSQQPEMQRAQQ